MTPPLGKGPVSQRQVLSTDQVSGPKTSQPDPVQHRVKFLDMRKEAERIEGEKRKSALKESASAAPREKSTSPDRVIQSSSPEVPRTVDKRSMTPEKIPEDPKGGKSREKDLGSKGAKGKASAGKAKESHGIGGGRTRKAKGRSRDGRCRERR